MSTREPKDRHPLRIARLVGAVVACLLLVTPGVARADHDDDNRRPTACVAQAPLSPFTAETVTFTSCSSDRDGWVRWHFWDLDDDGSFDDASGALASRTFATPGEYTMRLLVVDNEGGWDVEKHTVTVANRPPPAAFDSAPAAPLSGDAVTFTSSSSDPDGSVASQSWDLDNDGAFDDGSGTTASRSFATPGDHTVRLRVVDERGGSAVATRTVAVANRAPLAAFGFAPAAPPSGGTVTFTSMASDPDGSIASQSWDLDNDGAFDDGSGTTASRSFATPGDHTVRLRVVDDRGASAITTRTVPVANRTPVAAFGFTPAAPLSGETITFTSSSSDQDGSITSLYWDLDNDGEFDDGRAAAVSRAFALPGSYTVRLWVSDDRRAAAITTRIVVVGNRSPVATVSYGPQSPLTADEVTFDSSSSDPDGSIAARGWDLDDDGAFDDGDGATAARAFATAGQHTVRLRVVDDLGAATITAVSVQVGERPPDPPPAGKPFDVSTPVEAPAPIEETSPGFQPNAVDPLRFLHPFPVVRIRGRATREGARVSLFTVTGPAGARVRLRCSGRGCPFSSASGTVRPAAGRSRGVVRFRRIERSLRAGVVLTVLVTSDGFVGKYTRIVIRRLVAPRRSDRCLMPGSLRPRLCPPR